MTLCLRFFCAQESIKWAKLSPMVMKWNEMRNGLQIIPGNEKRLCFFGTVADTAGLNGWHPSNLGTIQTDDPDVSDQPHGQGQSQWPNPVSSVCDQCPSSLRHGVTPYNVQETIRNGRGRPSGEICCTKEQHHIVGNWTECSLMFLNGSSQRNIWSRQVHSSNNWLSAKQKCQSVIYMLAIHNYYINLLMLALFNTVRCSRSEINWLPNKFV